MNIKDYIETCNGHTYINSVYNRDEHLKITNWIIYGAYIWEFIRKKALPNNSLFGTIPVSVDRYSMYLNCRTLNYEGRTCVRNIKDLRFMITTRSMHIPALYLTLNFNEGAYDDLVEKYSNDSANSWSKFLFKCIMYSDWAFSEYTGDSKSEHVIIEVSESTYNSACSKEQLDQTIFRYYDEIASIILSKKICSFKDINPYVSENDDACLSISVEHNEKENVQITIDMEADADVVWNSYFTYVEQHFEIDDYVMCEDEALSLFKQNWFMSIILGNLMLYNTIALNPFTLSLRKSISFVIPATDITKALADKVLGEETDEEDIERSHLKEFIMKNPNEEKRKYKDNTCAFIILKNDVINIMNIKGVHLEDFHYEGDRCISVNIELFDEERVVYFPLLVIKNKEQEVYIKTVFNKLLDAFLDNELIDLREEAEEIDCMNKKNKIQWLEYK